jgi:glutamate dehydrogenase (NAD(P)+)
MSQSFNQSVEQNHTRCPIYRIIDLLDHICKEYYDEKILLSRGIVDKYDRVTYIFHMAHGITRSAVPWQEYRPICGEPPAAEPASAFSRVQSHVDMASWLLGIDDGVRQLLRSPQRELTVQVPLRRDDGHLVVLQGYRVQHNLAHGPTLGGLRYCAELSLDAVRAAAMRTTWQCAAAGLPFGGAAGGVVVDPASLSSIELERVTRRYTTNVSQLLGSDRDIPTVDAGTTSAVMAWVMDTLSMHRGYTAPATAVGKPPSVGGAGGHDLAARGIVTVIEEVCRAIGLALANASVVIVGSAVPNGPLPHLLAELGVTVYEGSDSAAFAQPCHILLLDVGAPRLSEALADATRAWIVVEAGGAVEVIADAMLESRGVLVVPDILTGVGQVMASYLEWVQGLQQFFWSEHEIAAQFDRVAADATQQALAIAAERRISLRAAALIFAVGRVAKAIATRGIYP